MRQKGWGFVRTPGLSTTESALFTMEATQMEDRSRTIGYLTRNYDKALTALFGPEYYVHSEFANVVARVHRGDDPDNVLDELNKTRSAHA